MKRIKKLVALVLSITVLSISINATAGTNSVFTPSRESVEIATEYAEEALDEFVEILMDNENFTSRISEKNEFGLATPYIVYHTDAEVQECIYYFPIVDEYTNKVVYLLETIYVDGTYVVNALDHMVDELNEIDYVNNECVVYLMNEDIYIESESDILNINRSSEENNSTAAYMMSKNSFSFMSFEKKQQLVSERTEELQEHKKEIYEDDIEKRNIKNYGSLSLYNPQKQYGYDMCWACAVATIQNYINQRVVTGFDVCTRMSIGYNDGGTIYDEQDALAKYNIYYDVIRWTGLTWSQIVTNINNGYPVIANGSNSSSVMGHAVTVYGYTGSSFGSGTLYIWNSALSNGYATMKYAQFTDGAGTAYDWDSSLSYY